MKKPLPTLSRLNELLRLDTESGLLYWKIWRGNTASAGSQAGCCRQNGYWAIIIDGSEYASHRVIWKMVTGNDPVNEIDHINGNKSDNRPLNMREASRQQNNRNTGKRPKNPSGFVGVYKSGKGWRASVAMDGKLKHLGSFQSITAAAEIAAKARQQVFGEFYRQPKQKEESV